MYQITVKDLLALCQQEVNNGNGDKHIVLSDDNEGNGYHGMFFGFAKCTKDYRDIISDSQYRSEKDTIVLGQRQYND